MDQDMGNTEETHTSKPVHDENAAETPDVGDATAEASTTPESEEMDVELPILQHGPKSNGEDSVMRIEIPDSEGVSEFSSPVKLDIEPEESRAGVTQQDGGLQTVTEVSEQVVEQEDIIDKEKTVMRTETPDSEEASEFSSPVKIGGGAGESLGGIVQTVSGLDAIGEVQEQEAEQEDTTMTDVSASVHSDEMVGPDKSRAEEGIDVGTASEAGKPEPTDARREMEHTIDGGEVLPSTANDGGDVIQETPSREMEDQRSADTTLKAVDGPDLEEETSPKGPTDGIAIHEPVTNKREHDGSIGAPEQTEANKETPIASNALNDGQIAMAAQKLFDETPPSTISDISNTAVKPVSFKTTTRSAIPDSDDDEDDKIPDAPGLNGDTQQPASNAASAPEGSLPTEKSPTMVEDGKLKISEIPPSPPKLGIRGQEPEKKAAASATSFKEANHELQAPGCKETTSSLAEVDKGRPLKRKETTLPSAQKIHSTQVQRAAEFPSLPQTEATPDLREGWLQEAAASAHTSKQHKGEVTKFTNTPSSPLQSSNYPSSIEVKIQQSPTASFAALEVSQNKDVLMAELKAMKIASIQSRNAALEAEIASKRVKLDELTKHLKQPAAETVKKHIKLLHDYNDIRDVGQGLVGMIADNRGVRIGELYDEFGVGLKD